jgi:uncharacterized protein (UPF0261 family)
MPTNDSGAVHTLSNSDNPQDSSTEAVNQVALDAIPTAKLRELVRECMEGHVDNQQLAVLRVAEQPEREILSKIAGTLRRSTAPVATEESE